MFINCYKQIGCCWILTFNFLPLFFDIIIYRLKQVSRCGYEMTKNVQKLLADVDDNIDINFAPGAEDGALGGEGSDLVRQVVQNAFAEYASSLLPH